MYQNKFRLNIRIYYRNVYSLELENMKEMDGFLDAYDLLYLKKDEVNN